MMVMICIHFDAMYLARYHSNSNNFALYLSIEIIYGNIMTPFLVHRISISLWPVE